MSQYDIMKMMNLGSFEFKDFIVNDLTITHKAMNEWYFREVFDNVDVLCEFMFYFYQYNFYPKMGGWRRTCEETRLYQFGLIRSRLDRALEKSRIEADKIK